MKDIIKVFSIFSQEKKRQCIILVGMMIFGGVLESAGIGAIFPLISLMEKPDYFSRYPFIDDFIKCIGIESHSGLIILCASFLIGIYFLKNVYLAFQLKYQRAFIRTNQSEYMTGLLSVYLGKDYLFHVTKNSAILLRNITSGGTVIFGNFLMAVLMLFTEIIAACSIWVMLVVVDSFTAIVVAGIMAMMIFLIVKSFRKYVVKQGEVQNKASAHYLKWINQALGAVKETKVMRKESFFIKEFQESYRVYALALNRYYFSCDLPRLMIEVLVVSGLLLLVIVKILAGYTPGEIVSLLGILALAAFRLMPSANRIVGFCNTIKNHMPLFDEIYRDLLEVRECLPDILKDTKDIKYNKLPFNDSIEIRNLYFSYKGNEKQVLADVNFTISKGNFVGIIGPSGAGKTTFVDVFLGLLSPDAGEILCDGYNVSANIKAWQANLAYVPQDIYLIDGSIKENVALGERYEDIDVDMVEQSLKMAELFDFIQEMPNKMDTVVGERGVLLSGGQRQRIGIARALYQRPDILVLDEATSALDNETEKSITSTILKLRGQVTIVSIAHRVSTLEQCDFKIKFENGNASIVY